MLPVNLGSTPGYILIQRLRTLLAHLAEHPADSLVDKVISHQRTYLQTADCRYRIPCRP